MVTRRPKLFGPLVTVLTEFHCSCSTKVSHVEFPFQCLKGTEVNETLSLIVNHVLRLVLTAFVMMS